MEPRKLNVGICFFSYGGNGGVSSEYPAIRDWFLKTVLAAKADERVADIVSTDITDTPITMNRNKAVLWARENSVDALVMVDSDMHPDIELGVDPLAKPFWDVAFDFVYTNWDLGPHVVCAPYCGPPPNENVYVFKIASFETQAPDTFFKVDQYSREEAAMMTGVQPCAAQPTGLILFDMRSFELTDPLPAYKALLEQGVPSSEARARIRPWFYYEYEDLYESAKCSTEDVTATRDICFAGHEKLGRDVIYCAWDCWAAHMKPKTVRKPRPLYVDSIGEKYRHAVLANRASNKRMAFVGTPVSRDKRRNGNGFAKELCRVSFPREEWEFRRAGGMIVIKEHLEAIDRLVKTIVAERKASSPDGLSPVLKLVELGTWVGESALQMHCSCVPMAHDIMCVDHFIGSASDRTFQFAAKEGREHLIETWRNNTSIAVDDIHLAVCDSADVEGAIEQTGVTPPYDLVYVDADHSYEGCKRDILAWLPYVGDGGFIGGHDYGANGFPGVKQAVDELFGDRVCQDETIWSVRVDKALKESLCADEEIGVGEGDVVAAGVGDDERVAQPSETG